MILVAEEQRRIFLPYALHYRRPYTCAGPLPSAATLPQKQELLRKGFDNGLYYQNGLYRTPYMMPIFHHSILTLKEKRLLEMDENKKTGLEVRSGEVRRQIVEPINKII